MKALTMILILAVAMVTGGCTAQADLTTLVQTSNAVAVDVIAIYNTAPNTPGIAQAAIDANANLIAAIKVQADFSGWPTPATLTADVQIGQEILAWFLANWHLIVGVFGENGPQLKATPAPLPVSAVTAAQIEIWRNRNAASTAPK